MDEIKAEKKFVRAAVLPGPRKLLFFVAAAAAVSYPLFSFFGAEKTWEAFLFIFLLFFPAMEDARTGYISDVWCLALAVCGAGLCALHAEWTGIFGAAGVFAFLFLLHRWKPDALGGGDVGLAAAIAVWLPGEAAPLFLWLSFFLGSLYGLLLLVMKKKTLTDGVSFGPFLCLGGGVAYFFGEAVLSYYGSLR